MSRLPLGIFSARYLMLIVVLLLALSLSTPAVAKLNTSRGKNPIKLDKKTRQFEIQYLKKSIDKHAKMIFQLQNVDNIVTHIDLLAFAHVFIDGEQAEMAMLQAMLKEWYFIDYSPKPRLDEEEELAETADELDIMGSIIGYNNSEIAWAKQVEKKGLHPELKAFAKEEIISSRAQVLELKSWLRLLETDSVDPEI